MADSAPRGSTHDAVAVAGAGPVGMSAALALARCGVASVLLEARERLSGEGSRSICTQGHVLATLERLGCAEALLAKGVWWTLGRTYFRDTELFCTHLPASTGEDALPPFINIGQQDVEAFLLEAVEKSELVDLRWGHEVTGVRQDAEGVTLAVAGPDGALELRAPYAVACDGPHSRLRKLLGVELPGHSYEDRFLIADIRAQLPFPNERRFYFDPPFNPGRQVLIHQQPDGVWRIDWQVPPDTDVEEERRTGRLDARIRAVIGDADYELVWLSSYRFHQRVAERFRVGRVFLAGDAAHLMAPFGARGLNSGIHDVENLAWKLGLVLAGTAPDALLDSYHNERHEAARANVDTVTATMRFMVPRTRAGWWLRNATLRGSLRLPVLRRFVNSGRLYQPATYRRSPVILRAPGLRPLPERGGRGRLRAGLPERVRGHLRAGLPEPGSLAPDVPCAVAGDPAVRRLRRLVGDGFLVLALPPDAAAAARVAAQAGEVRAAVPLRLALVAPPGRHAPPGHAAPGHAPPDHAPPGRHAPPGGDAGATLFVSDPDGALRRTYGDDRLYLVRPDGYIAARGRSRDAARLADWLDVAIGRGLPGDAGVRRAEARLEHARSTLGRGSE